MTVSAADLRRLVIQMPADRVDGDLAPSITAAALIRSEDLAGSGLSTDRLDLIELYLAAHFEVLAVEGGGLVSSRQGTSQDVYRQVAQGLLSLQSTRFGQLVLSLDKSGILQASMSAKKAQLKVVRSVEPPNESIDGVFSV